MLSKLSDQAKEADQVFLRGMIHQFGSRNGNPKPEIQSLYQEFACRELASEVFSSTQDLAFVFDHGKLGPQPGNLCDGISLDRPYDSADWLTSAPPLSF
ncbi:MAG: hypothetical protein H7222_08270 [Methylotenera sp.]|nr:hypothetical protein [Oligoflexia bacterium]